MLRLYVSPACDAPVVGDVVPGAAWYNGLVERSARVGGCAGRPPGAVWHTTVKVCSEEV
jgi:hypothetical protein